MSEIETIILSVINLLLNLLPIILMIIAIIISIIVLYRNTRLVCKIGIHQYKKEGMAYRTPIEDHYVCSRCGKTETVYRK